MIGNALIAGCLAQTLKDFEKQRLDDMKFQRWLAHGGAKTYSEFYGEEGSVY